MRPEIYISGLATRLGSDVITAEELAERFAKPLRRITRQAGITKLHRFSKDESLVGLACDAAKEAISGQRMMDGIYSSTASPTTDLLMPGLARMVAHRLGKDGRALSIGMGCAGGIQALESAYNQCLVDRTLENKDSNYLVIVGDQVSRNLDGRWETAPLFSEGVAAIVVSNYEAVHSTYKIENIFIGTVKAETEDLLSMRIENPMVKSPQGGPIIFEMDGERTARFAVEKVIPLVSAPMRFGTSDGKLPDNCYIIPHQASGFILEHMIARNGLNPELVYTDGIREIGNVLGASVFFGLQDAERKGYIGDREVMLVGFGAELAVGAAYLKRVGR